MTAAQPGTHSVGQRFPKYSEEWYWELLVDQKPFRSVFEQPDSTQPLILKRTINLSQTPREQCELEGRVREGLERGGPGQEVVLHGLKSCPELNGRHGRLLPPSGTGAPAHRAAPGRVAVRLADGGREVAVRPENLRSPHSATAAEGGAAAPAAAGAPAGAPPPQQPQQQEPASPCTAEVARLLELEFSKWHTAPCLKPSDLRHAGMPPAHARCCACARGGEAVGRYVALKRTAPLRAAPLPAAALRLLCLDCYVASAVAEGLPLTEKAMEEYVDGTMMGAMEACMQLMGNARVQWGG